MRGTAHSHLVKSKPCANAALLRCKHVQIQMLPPESSGGGPGLEPARASCFWHAEAATAIRIAGTVGFDRNTSAFVLRAAWRVRRSIVSNRSIARKPDALRSCDRYTV